MGKQRKKKKQAAKAREAARESADQATSGPQPPVERILVAVLLLAALATAAIPQIRLFDRVLQDDAYISFTYSRNMAEGHGLVYNAGEAPVEGYTNFLWTFLVGVGMWAGFNPAHVAQVMSMLASFGAVLLVWRLTVCLGVPAALAALASLLLASKAPLWAETMGGLETTMFTFLVLGAVVLRLSGEASRRREIYTSLVLAAAALTRPEGVLFFGLFEIFNFLEWLVRKGETSFPEYVRRVVWRAIPFVLVVGTHVLWRYATYGDIVPNTFHAKVAGNPGLYKRGLVYVWSGILDFAPKQSLALLFFLPFVVFLWRRKDRAWQLCLFLSLAFIAYQISVGGDYKNTIRFLIPILPVWCALAVAGVHFAAARITAAPKLARQGVAALVIIVLGGWSAHLHYESTKAIFNRWLRVAQLKAIGRHLDETLPPEAWIAVSNAGIIPYYSKRRTIDMWGLSDAHIARSPAKLGTAMDVGHQKGDGEYVLRQSPDAILFFAMESMPRPVVMNPNWLQVARRFAFGPSEREIAAHPEFANAYLPKAARMPDGTYLNYFVRRSPGT